MSSFISAPMIMLSPARIHLCNAISMSSKNACLGLRVSLLSLRYLICWACTVSSPLPSLLECNTGQYALIIRRWCPFLPLYLVEVHLPRPVGSSSMPQSNLAILFQAKIAVPPHKCGEVLPEWVLKAMLPFARRLRGCKVLLKV